MDFINSRIPKHISDEAARKFIPNQAVPPLDQLETKNRDYRKSLENILLKNLDEVQFIAIVGKIVPKHLHANLDTELNTIFKNFREFTSFIAQLNAELSISIDSRAACRLKTLRDLFNLIEYRQSQRF